jgi:hypothetical protein
VSPGEEEELMPVVPPISLKFEVPEFDRHEVYRVVLEDGSIVFRSKEELERAKPPETPGGKR